MKKIILIGLSLIFNLALAEDVGELELEKNCPMQSTKKDYLIKVKLSFVNQAGYTAATTHRPFMQKAVDHACSTTTADPSTEAGREKLLQDVSEQLRWTKFTFKKIELVHPAKE